MTVDARDIEAATILTWPAAITERHFGWFYLAAGGITGRVNAVWPLGWDGADLDAAIAHAEEWYQARTLPPRFKLTDGAYAPPHLAEALAQRGYEAVSPTLVMTAPIVSREPEPGVILGQTMTPGFEAALASASKDEQEFDERRAIALRAGHLASFAMIEIDQQPASIGMSAAAGELTGIFLMRTASAGRRKGYARRILRGLLARSAQWGATSAFLQVEADNAPAIALYESEGFTTLTTYRFWRKHA